MSEKLLVLMILLLSLAGAGGCGRRDSGPKAAEKREDAGPAVLVNAAGIAVAGVRHLEAGVSFSGELSPQTVTTVTARFEGDLDEVRVREGQRVRRGQSLAAYRPQDVKDAAKTAEAGLLSAQAGLAAAENGERRARKLFEAGAASQGDLDAATAARSAAQAQLRAAEAASNHAQEDSERLKVPSPINGWVSQVVAHNGIRTAIGDRLFTVVDNDTMELSATLPSEALSQIVPGTSIRFHIDSYPGEVFEGRIDRVNPTTEPGTRQIRVYTRIPNPGGRLVGGLYAGGRIVTASKDQAVAAPLGVLRKEGAEQVVYRLRSGRADRQVVQTGMVDEESGWVELLGQIAAGDSLLSGIVPGLQQGVRIRILAANGQAGGPGK
jgi:membrane fusion protein, multidrug efflux system